MGSFSGVSMTSVPTAEPLVMGAGIGPSKRTLAVMPRRALRAIVTTSARSITSGTVAARPSQTSASVTVSPASNKA